MGVSRLGRFLPIVLCWLAAPPMLVAGIEPRSEQPASDQPALRSMPRTPDGPDETDVSEFLEQIRAEHDVPALAGYAIRLGDRPAHGKRRSLVGQGVAGKRAVGHDADATLHDLWHIGSCTKAMTATLCALLVQDGKLRWDSTIGEVFTDRADQIPDHYKPVTLEQLLYHTSGLPANLPPSPVWLTLQRSKAPPERDRDIAFQLVMKQQPLAKPGEKFEYSNMGYMIAGHMAEKVTGTPYEDLMRERIFEPLRMSSAGFGPPGEPGKFDQPRGHAGGEPVEIGFAADNPKCYAPAGTVHCSMSDWAAFAMLHVRAAQGEETMLTQESIAKLHTPSATTERDGDGYAMGWGLTKRRWASTDGKSLAVTLTHNGSNTMWYCSVWIGPDADLAVMAACNSAGENAERAVDQACAKLIELVPEMREFSK